MKSVKPQTSKLKHSDVIAHVGRWMMETRLGGRKISPTTGITDIIRKFELYLMNIINHSN